MSIRHLVAYMLMAILIAGIAIAIRQWQRARYERRHPHRVGSARR